MQVRMFFSTQMGKPKCISHQPSDATSLLTTKELNMTFNGHLGIVLSSHAAL
jgi:hypothetical protein